MIVGFQPWQEMRHVYKYSQTALTLPVHGSPCPSIRSRRKIHPRCAAGQDSDEFFGLCCDRHHIKCQASQSRAPRARQTGGFMAGTVAPLCRGTGRISPREPLPRVWRTLCASLPGYTSLALSGG